MIPIIKWAGSKRQLLSELQARIPHVFGRYVEPFLGSGALFLELQPKQATLNDCNPELINMYTCIRDCCDELFDNLVTLQKEYNELTSQKDKELFYYKMRDEFNERMLNANLGVRDASLFIFLNKTCYNGLYRVNTAGTFNTPSGKKRKVSISSKAQFQRCSDALSNAIILNGDFELACQNVQAGDFVYFDSPYYDTFDTYQPGGFPEQDHQRLAQLYQRLSEQGVYCLLSNSDTAFIRDLYEGSFIDVVSVKRMINCNGQQRTGTELIIRNYQ